jgi:hypothetical protein
MNTAAREARLQPLSRVPIHIPAENRTIRGATDEALYNVVSGLSADDHVLVIAGFRGGEQVIADVLIPETVTGRITANALNGPRTFVASVTVGGTVYSLANDRSAYDGLAAIDGVATPGRRDAILTLDQHGYVVHIDNIGASDSEMVYIIEFYNGIVGGRQHPFFRGVLADGTEINARVAGANTAPLQDPNVGGRVRNFTLDGTIYTLTPALDNTTANIATSSSFVSLINNGSIASGAVGLSAANATTARNLFSRDVRFIYVHGPSTDPLRDITVREGVQRVPNLGLNSFAIVEARGGVPVVVAVVVLGQAPVGVIDRTQLLFISGTRAGQEDVGDDRVGLFPAFLNGVPQGNVRIAPPTAAGSPPVGFYTFTLDANNVHTLTQHDPPADSASRPGAGIISQVVGNTVVAGGFGFTITSATQIIDTRSPAAQDPGQGGIEIVPNAAGLRYVVHTQGRSVTVHFIYDASADGTGVASIVYITGAS